MYYRHFKLEEFTCKCGCGQNLINPDFVGRLDDLRHEYGTPLIVTSGYRCPKYNSQVSTTGPDGPHTTGHAADIGISRAPAIDLLELVLSVGKFKGIGINQKGSNRFLHLDDLPNGPGCPRPTIWTY